MTFKNVRLDSAGLSKVLTGSKVSGLVADAAHSTALAAERTYPEPHTGHVAVEVEEYTASGGKLPGSRTAYHVVAKHAAALGMEAKHGVLVQAAASAGLEVKAR